MHCLLEFTGVPPASGITAYIRSTPTCGVSECEIVPAYLLASMQQEHGKRVKKEQEFAGGRVRHWGALQ